MTLISLVFVVLNKRLFTSYHANNLEWISFPLILGITWDMKLVIREGDLNAKLDSIVSQFLWTMSRSSIFSLPVITPCVLNRMFSIALQDESESSIIIVVILPHRARKAAERMSIKWLQRYFSVSVVGSRRRICDRARRQRKMELKEYKMEKRETLWDWERTVPVRSELFHYFLFFFLS